MTGAPTFTVPDEPAAPTQPTLDLLGLGLGEWLRELIWTGAMTQPRSLQSRAGMSELGNECDRRLAYKARGTPHSNIRSDPMPTLVGTGLHLVLASIMERQDTLGRWRIECPVEYRGIAGTVDAYDTRRRLLIDWKSTSKSKARQLPRNGISRGYLVQANLYVAALKAAGEDPQQAALVYLPRDGALTDLIVMPVPIDPAIADKAVDRYEALAQTSPDAAIATPSALCGWCPYYKPGTTELLNSCPGGAHA